MISTFVGGISTPPGKPGFPAPTTVPPDCSISGKALAWFGVRGAVEDDFASVSLGWPVAASLPTKSTRVFVPLSVFIVSC